MGKTSKDLTDVAEAVLQAKARGRETCTINGVTFDDNIYDPAGGGRCQENARKVYEATTGEPMPGKACCAGATYRNLVSRYLDHRVQVGYSDGGRPDRCEPGDYLFFGGGPNCHTCGRPVGHVGIWLGKGRMFQHTSRLSLGITQQGPTEDQVKRFLGAFRMVPLYEPTGLKIIDLATGKVLAMAEGRWKLATHGDHSRDQSKVYVVAAE